MTLLMQDDGAAQYNILVRSETGEEQAYRTLELLYEQGAEYLVGRGTRVWKALKIENGEEVGEPVVLKDAWVDHHREREGTINSRVRESAITRNHRDVFDMGLLTILSHGDVFVAAAPDRTPWLPQGSDPSDNNVIGSRGATAINEHNSDESATQDEDSGSYSTGGHDPTTADDRVDEGSAAQEKASAGDRDVTTVDKHVDDDPRTSPQPSYQVHYRIVYKEIGKPLGTLTSLYSIFKALREVTCGTSQLTCRNQVP